MLPTLATSPSASPHLSASGLFRGSTLGFFSQSEVEFSIRLDVVVSSAPRLVSQDSSPPQVRHVEVMQPERTQELPQLV